MCVPYYRVRSVRRDLARTRDSLGSWPQGHIDRDRYTTGSADLDRPALEFTAMRKSAVLAAAQRENPVMTAASRFAFLFCRAIRACLKNHKYRLFAHGRAGFHVNAMRCRIRTKRRAKTAFYARHRSFLRIFYPKTPRNTKVSFAVVSLENAPA